MPMLSSLVGALIKHSVAPWLFAKSVKYLARGVTAERGHRAKSSSVVRGSDMSSELPDNGSGVGASSGGGPGDTAASSWSALVGRVVAYVLVAASSLFGGYLLLVAEAGRSFCEVMTGGG